MAQFDILTAKRAGKHSVYHSGEWIVREPIWLDVKVCTPLAEKKYFLSISI